MIPTVEDLKSSPMNHRFGDLFNPPGLTNFLGSVQSEGHDPVAVRSLAFPPFGNGELSTGGLYVNGKFFPAWGQPVTTVWRPDRIERWADADGLSIRSVTVLVPGKMAAAVRIEVGNRSGAARQARIKLGLRGAVTRAFRPWDSAVAPAETDNLIEIDRARGALRFTARHSSAAMVQGCFPMASDITPTGLQFGVQLAAGQTATFYFVVAIGGDIDEAIACYDGLIRDVDALIGQAEAEWNTELRAIFTPGNTRYSGHLPVLETTDREVLKVYHLSACGIAYFKRDSPYNVRGRAYGTLMPRYWHAVTFLWDYSLSSLVHALLDPAVMKGNLMQWMKLDIHKHFGTDFLTGAGVGPWYSVNDYAMGVIARDYLRFSGDLNFLNARIEGEPVYRYLEGYARNYRRFAGGSGLADYGGLNNLLECVNTYLHEVASLNAAAVWNLRFAAELASLRGERSLAGELLEEARELASRVKGLYVPGKGYWRARFPDGSEREVRHVYDFITVLNTMHEDLSSQQQAEMVDFFRRELMTPTWLHALSCDDDDAMFSVRPDHQWTGSYPAWPPQAVTALYKIGQVDLAFEWLKGLARSGNQGPYGQAHFCETVVPPEAGGAIKAPGDFPYINDWTVSSCGAWANIIIESIFGVRAGLHTIDATPQFGRFEPNSVLRNLAWQGRLFTVTRAGLRT